MKKYLLPVMSLIITLVLSGYNLPESVTNLSENSSAPITDYQDAELKEQNNFNEIVEEESKRKREKQGIWEDSCLVPGSITTKETADEIFEKAIAGELLVNATNDDGTNASYRIPDLIYNSHDTHHYKVGKRIDLDNDGVDELIIDGPYGGIYLDARNGKVYQLAKGNWRREQLANAEYKGKTYVCIVDDSFGGTQSFMMYQYNGKGEIVETISLAAEY